MRLRVPFPQSGLVMVGLMMVFIFIHRLVPALALPAGGPFPSGSFHIQWTVDRTVAGSCVGLVHASEPGDPYRLAPVALEPGPPLGIESFRERSSVAAIDPIPEEQ